MHNKQELLLSTSLIQHFVNTHTSPVCNSILIKITASISLQLYILDICCPFTHSHISEYETYLTRQ